MNSPVKRVETETVITHVCHRAGTTRTNTPVHRPRTAIPQGNTSFQDLGPVTGTGRSDTCVDRWRISTLLAGVISDTFAVSH